MLPTKKFIKKYWWNCRPKFGLRTKYDWSNPNPVVCLLRIHDDYQQKDKSNDNQLSQTRISSS